MQMTNKYSKTTAGTFVPNKIERIHRWYPYLEGYSSCLIKELIQEIGLDRISGIYDPFCGTGTTSLVASSCGITSYYSETNPFMRMVIETKINVVKFLRESGIGSSILKDFLNNISTKPLVYSSHEISWEGFEKFFDNDVLQKLLSLKARIGLIEEPNSKQIAMVALASIIVRSSKMIRRGDLRVAKDTEKNQEDKDVLANFINKLESIIEDIDSSDCNIFAGTTCLSPDSREINEENLVDCVITSPPYLNGTNYIRNTKLELKLTDFICSEADLPELHSKGIIAGINNVSKRKGKIDTLQCVRPYIDKLTPVAYDKRIPLMVAGYFFDMNSVIAHLAKVIKNDGFLIIDIGDSQFAGVHIPTHEILINICNDHGFVLYSEDVLRERRSKNGNVLSQRLLKFRLKKELSIDTSFYEDAINFVNDLPYRKTPYSGRNWGHPLHSLCSYHGKLKPAIAHFMVSTFTKKGDVVLDPLCGVGTIPLEACLQGRIGIGNDLSELAYSVTKAKIEKTNLEDCMVVLKELETFIADNKDVSLIHEDVKKYSEFGFNGKLPSYFHPDTFIEILCARRFFIPKIRNFSPSESMVFSCLLHVLHGNRPYALSRNSHPLTPYAPTGEFVYKNVITHILNKLKLVFSRDSIIARPEGVAILGDYKELNMKNAFADAIICSPPFADSIRFYMQNWMRLWLCGWELADYKTADELFLDQKQKTNFDVYTSFFEMCFRVLKPRGKVILHLGKTAKIDMAEELSKRASPYFKEIYRGCENVQSVEKHGIKDKGATLEHQFLFLLKQ